MENEIRKWMSSNPHTDCAFFPKVGQFVIMNNSDEHQYTTVYNGEGKATQLPLAPMEMLWYELEEINQRCN
jgi:1,3-beta-galactosyl-N-acetylhexosamine phosphorylase